MKYDVLLLSSYTHKALFVYVCKNLRHTHTHARIQESITCMHIFKFMQMYIFIAYFLADSLTAWPKCLLSVCSRARMEFVTFFTIFIIFHKYIKLCFTTACCLSVWPPAAFLCTHTHTYLQCLIYNDVCVCVCHVQAESCTTIMKMSERHKQSSTVRRR